MKMLRLFGQVFWETYCTTRAITKKHNKARDAEIVEAVTDILHKHLGVDLVVQVPVYVYDPVSEKFTISEKQEIKS